MTNGSPIWYNIYVMKGERKMKVTENMVNVLGVLNGLEGGKGFAKDVLAGIEGKTFNAVNATLAACAGKGLCTKEKMACGEKMLTCYTITDAGKEILVKDEDAE